MSGGRAKTELFFQKYFLKCLYLKAYQAKHLLETFQKKFPRFQYNLHIIFCKV